MTNPNLNLTNQELLSELDRRVKEGNIKVDADVETESNSLLTNLFDSKIFLLLALGVVICLASVQKTNIKGNISLSDNSKPS